MAPTYFTINSVHRLPVLRQRFDKDSGLVYKETLVSAPRVLSRRAAPRFQFSPQTSGAPSLQDMAIRSFLANIESTSYDTLLDLPWTIGKRLWQLILQFELERPSLWYAFAAAFPDEEQFQYFRGSEINLQKPFAEYLDYLSCPNLQWLTCLTLSNISLDRADLMRIPTLQNLLAIDIYSSCPSHDCQADTMIDDKILRDWGRIAQEAGSFQRLRVIILRNQHRVTAASLEHLSAFPSLTLFGVKGCHLTDRDNKSAQKHGWTACDLYGLVPTIQSEIEKSHHWDGALNVCVRHSATLLSPSSPPDPPILSFRLGHTSNDILYSTPILFFRRHPNTLPNHLTTPSTDTQVLENPTTQAATKDPQETTTILQVTTKLPPTLTPIATKPEPLNPAAKKSQPDNHLHKKRKIRVSVQHRFGSLLSDFGIDIVSPEKKSDKDPPTNQANPR